MAHNKALQPTASPFGLSFPRSLRSLGAAERGRWVSQMQRSWLPLLLVLFMPGLTGCSAIILAIGEPEQRSIIHAGSKRNDISAYLGAPIERADVEPPLAANDLIQQHKATYGLSDTPTATTLETYRYTGWVQNNHDVGEAAALAGYTLFLSELVMVPLAIKTQIERSDTTHVVKVWYDATDTAVAYQWLSEN